MRNCKELKCLGKFKIFFQGSNKIATCSIDAHYNQITAQCHSQCSTINQKFNRLCAINANYADCSTIKFYEQRNWKKNDTEKLLHYIYKHRRERRKKCHKKPQVCNEVEMAEPPLSTIIKERFTKSCKRTTSRSKSSICAYIYMADCTRFYSRVTFRKYINFRLTRAQWGSETLTLYGIGFAIWRVTNI